MTSLPIPMARASHAIAWLRATLPGLALSAAVGALAVFSTPWVAKVFPIPAMVIALLIVPNVVLLVPQFILYARYHLPLRPSRIRHPPIC